MPVAWVLAGASAQATSRFFGTNGRDPLSGGVREAWECWSTGLNPGAKPLKPPGALNGNPKVPV